MVFSSDARYVGLFPGAGGRERRKSPKTAKKLAEAPWCWYRDPGGGPAGFNLSDEAQLTVCP